MGPEDKGGVVTTVKEEFTKDLDVIEALRQNTDEGEEKPAEKPADKPATRGKAPEVDDDDQDFYNSLTDEQKAKARRFFKTSRELRKEVRDLRNDVREIARKPTGEKPDRAEPEPVKGREPQTLEDLGPMPKYPDAKAWKGTQEDFDKAYEDTEEARYQWRKTKERVEDAVEKARDRDAKVVADFNEKQEKFIKDHEDYQELVDNQEPMTNTMFGAVLKYGPALLYHLAQNKDEARAIYTLGDTQEAVEAIIETWVGVKQAMKASKKDDEPAGDKPAKQKPEPAPTPVGGRTAAAPAAKDPSKMTFKEREQQMFRQNPGRFKYKPI